MWNKAATAEQLASRPTPPPPPPPRRNPSATTEPGHGPACSAVHRLFVLACDPLEPQPIIMHLATGIRATFDVRGATLLQRREFARDLVEFVGGAQR